MTSLGVIPRHTSSDHTTFKKMALGSKTSFKSYIEVPAEESLISFDDADITSPSVNRSDQINDLENSVGDKSGNTVPPKKLSFRFRISLSDMTNYKSADF